MLKRSCRQISEIRSQSSDGSVRVVQRLQMWVHARMCTCPVCKSFDSHLLTLRDCVKGAFVDLDNCLEHIRLDDTAKQRMTETMKSEQETAAKEGADN